MKINIECPNCGEILEIEFNDLMEVISVEHLETPISEEDSKKLLDESGIEFGISNGERGDSYGHL